MNNDETEQLHVVGIYVFPTVRWPSLSWDIPLGYHSNQPRAHHIAAHSSQPPSSKTRTHHGATPSSSQGLYIVPSVVQKTVKVTTGNSTATATPATAVVPSSSASVTSFPGSCGSGEKKSLVHTVCACSVPAGILWVWKIVDIML